MSSSLYNTANTLAQVDIVGSHPLTAGLSGAVTVLDTAGEMTTGESEPAGTVHRPLELADPTRR